jgi:ribokinase
MRLPAVRQFAALSGKRVVVLPDIFLDVLVALPPWPRWQRDAAGVVARGGGNLHLPGSAVSLASGGNSANLAVWLARLGARVSLIGQTDALGHAILAAAAPENLDLARVRVGPNASRTVALEFPGANLMLSDSGPLARFGPDRLAPADWRLVQGADAVLFANWAQNRAGTALLAAVARRARRDALVFVDTGDARPRAAEARRLVEHPLWQRVDAWGMNLNEARVFSGRDGTPRALALHLSRRIPATIDLHTRTGAWSASAGRVESAPALRSKARRLTGAGDAWNAGNVAGYLLGWTPRRRLHLAHKVATEQVLAR